MLTTSTQRFLATSAVLLVVLVGGYFLFVDKAVAPAPGDGGPTATSTNATSTGMSGSNQPVLQTPNYKKPITFSAAVSAETRTQLNAELKVVQTSLDKNALDMKAWVDLGALRKMGGDYQGAREAWEFVLSVLPNNVSAAFNLGDLYMSYLKDSAKAETYFNQVIKLQPTNVNAYANLYTMYHYTLKNDTKAAAILEQGLAANPGNNYLLGLQSELSAK